MADTSSSSPVVAMAKKSKAVAKKPSSKPSHPKTSDMVNSAIKNMKERGGSSLQAIKKYMVSNYKVDADKLAPFIRKHLKAAVASGVLVQTKGKGASGSFKLAKEADKPKTAKKAAPKKAAVKDNKKPKSSPKKPVAKKAVPAKKKPASEAAPKKLKSPAKAKKAKAPAAKKPKPKKSVAKKSSPKKAAPKKK